MSKFRKLFNIFGLGCWLVFTAIQVWADALTPVDLCAYCFEITPRTGSYVGQVNIFSSHNYPEGTIRYTLDGTAPTQDSPPFPDQLVIKPPGATLRASLWLPHDVLPRYEMTDTYVVHEPSVSFDPPSGPGFNDMEVKIISNKPGATIAYQIWATRVFAFDGRVVAGSVITGGGEYSSPVKLAAPEFANEGIADLVLEVTLSKAGEAEENYRAVYSFPTVPIVFDPPPTQEIYDEPVLLSLVCDPGATIRFTLDGTIPTQSTHKYSGPFLVLPGQTVTALAEKPGFPKTVVSRTYDSECSKAARLGGHPQTWPMICHTLLTSSPAKASQTRIRVEKSKRVITWDSEMGVEYQLERSSDFQNWFPIGAPMSGIVPGLGVAEPISERLPTCFYRVKATRLPQVIFGPPTNISEVEVPNQLPDPVLITDLSQPPFTFPILPIFEIPIENIIQTNLVIFAPSVIP